ncbi:PAS domain S-box protein [Duganella sp. FT135W]|uniref:Sensor protein FixL n=1 Tax=Duganella flavida TaxID=2692175 RepID=A0A6L8K559_9BURK|nr:PAS domain-containing hybrid sensor histidine kinase/response regulator [Duganella flavida]MYM22643.1 PAS domain S-box protein [Duganella flavida]
MSASTMPPAPLSPEQDLHRLTLMIDSVSDAIITINSRGVIEYVNRGAQELFGYRREQLLGRNVSMLMSSPDSEHHDAYIRAYLETGQSRVMNHRRGATGLRQNGTTVPLDLTLGQMQQDGEQKFTAIMRDVTEQRRLQQLAVEAERGLQAAKNRADDANRAKSVFLATMSHEIRTPMNGVIGSLELLGLSNLTMQQRETVQMAEQSGRELLRILDDILDFSKIEAGRLELHYERTALREQVIDKVVATYAHLASKKGLRLHRRVDSQVAQWVCTDQLRLRQILHNFVSNAVKFTLKGEIEVALDMVEFGPYSQFLRFSVKDTGIGISAENQGRLFRPFVQADGDTTRRFGGSGLGLAICQGLAYNMGASIFMESTPGLGTTMSLAVELPVTDPGVLRPAAHIASAAAPLPPTAGATVAQAATQRRLVLVVDDHATNRQVLLRQLGSLGYAAESAANGIEALDMLATGQHSLVISDCQMPEMDGYTLARTIRQLEASSAAPASPPSRLPVIAFTANAFASDEARARDAGMDDFLAKPTTIGALKAVLERYLPSSGDDTVLLAGRTPPSLAPDHRRYIPLDEVQLSAITGGNANARLEFIVEFQQCCQVDVATLRIAYQSLDAISLQRAAHRICGASKTIGASALAAACSELETACVAQQAQASAPAMIDAWSEQTRLAHTRLFLELAAFNDYIAQGTTVVHGIRVAL